MSATTSSLRPPISSSLRRFLVESFTGEQLRHIASALDAREHVPDDLALALADEIAAIYSSPDMASEYGPIRNAMTIGWWKRRAERIAEAKAS